MAADLLARKRAHYFNVMDKNSNGLLERSDLVRFADALASIRDWAPGSEGHERVTAFLLGWWDALKATADVNDDGVVSCEEFSAALAFAKPQDFTAAGHFLFDLLDADGDGRITAEEYARHEAALFAEGANPDPGETFARLDHDGDGAISRDDFTARVVEFNTSDDEDAAGNVLFGFRG